MLKLILILLSILHIVVADPFQPLDTEFLRSQAKPKIKVQPVKTPVTPQSVKNALPKYQDIIKNMEKLDGLFTFYFDKKKNKLLIEIKPEHLQSIYLANLTRKSGDGMYYDAGSMLWEYPFIFEVHAEKIQLIHINSSFRADESSPIYKSISNNLSNSLISTGKIISQPHVESGAFLVNANELFLMDLTYVSQHRKGKYKFDQKNSFFNNIQSFPLNSEIEIKAYFKSNNWTGTFTLPNSHSMIHSYHLSLSNLPDNDFTPRLADDRIGYFSTIYQDYTSTLKETPYVRYINKWNLQKKYPSKKLSEPIEPIVYWLENTIPYEFRDAVKAGILAWNSSFEKIGFKNAIVVKQMPDDATWNPGDVRYNTIRWIVQPGSAYAVGPSRANPFTGELYDADIRISADFTRAFYKEYDEFVVPVTSADGPIAFWEKEHSHNHDEHQCNYGHHLREQMIFSWHALTNNNPNANLNDYIKKGLTDLVLHEVGHTLGLRHNFKASSIFTLEELSNPEFTNKNGISGSVMDYHPVSLLDNGNTMFQTQPGPYDDWAISYGYLDFGFEDKIKLEAIAQRSNEPLLAYGTDEDAFGLSSRGIDPLCNTWDMGSSPVAYYKNQIQLVDHLWDNIIKNFEKEGTRFQKIRSVFSQGIGEYYAASRTAAKFIGGIYYSRNHIGDPNQKNPFIIVDPQLQREALAFINTKILDQNAFNFNQELLNKLSPERYDDFTNYVWRMTRIDYPIHNVIKRIQAVALYSLFDPRRISRLQDNELRYTHSDKFTMAELFNNINQFLWIELSQSNKINSFRRELQKNYIDLLKIIIVEDNLGFPNDAKNLARANLKTTLLKIYQSLSKQNLDEYTQVHLESSAETIELILNAKLNLN